MSFLSNIPIFSDFILPIADIALLSFLLFKLYNILEETRAVQILRGAVVLAFVYAVAWVFQLSTLLWLLKILAPGLFIGIAIVFQPELRNIIAHIGQRKLWGRKTRQKTFQIDPLLNAAISLSAQRRGALMVILRSTGIKGIIDTGTMLNADLSSALIISIFAYDGPLHDGAIVVGAGKLIAAGCFLPLSRQQDIWHSFGTRHRAALGMVEETDAIVLVVSEETGSLSLAYEGAIFYDLREKEIHRRLTEILGEEPRMNTNRHE